MTNLFLPRPRRIEESEAESARVRVNSHTRRRLIIEVRKTDHRIARLAILQLMSLIRLHRGLSSERERHLHLHQMSTTWEEKYLEVEGAISMVAISVVAISVVESTEEAEAKEAITMIVLISTIATTLTTKLETATGTCQITAATTTSTSPKSSTDNRMEEAGVTMCQDQATTQQLVDLSDLTTSLTSLSRGGKNESSNPSNSRCFLQPYSDLT